MSKDPKARSNIEVEGCLLFRPIAGETDEVFGLRLHESVLASIAKYRRECPDKASDDHVYPDHVDAWLRGMTRSQRLRQKSSSELENHRPR